MQTGALRQLDIKVNYACINMSQHPGYKIKDLCEKQGASLLLALCIATCHLVWLHYFKHYITDIYFQCLVDAHSSNPEARELV